MSANVKDVLRTYVPGGFPRSMLSEHAADFKRAYILEPEKWLSQVSYVSFVIVLVLAVAAYFLPHNLRFSIPGIANPIPPGYRSITYALLTYLSLPIVFRFIASTALSGRISARREDINMNLHALHVTLLGFAKAKLHIKDVVREVVTLNLGEVSKEFARIYYAMRYAGKTLKAAMLEVASTTPSEGLADLLRGIVGVLEAGGNLTRYLEDRIRMMEVERKILFTEYLKKLDLAAEVYLTVSLAVPTMVISMNLAKSVAGQANLTSVYGLIYLFMPISSLILVLILHSSSPEKGVERPGMKYLTLIPVSTAVGLLIALVTHINPEFSALAATIIGSAAAAIVLRGKVREDEELSSQIPQYFNRVISLVEAGKDITTAFKVAASEQEGVLRNYVVAFAEMLDKGVSRDRAFNWLFGVTPSSDLKLSSRILSKTVNVSGKIVEVLLALSSELTRLNAFRKERLSSAKMYGGIMVITTLMFFGIATAMSVMLLGQFEKLGSVAASTSLNLGSGRFAISPVVVESARTILRHACYVVGVSAAVGVAAVRGDFRHIAAPLAAMLGIAFALAVLFLHLHPL